MVSMEKYICVYKFRIQLIESQEGGREAGEWRLTSNNVGVGKGRETPSKKRKPSASNEE